jgi:hypothetical protein
MPSTVKWQTLISQHLIAIFLLYKAFSYFPSFNSMVLVKKREKHQMYILSNMYAHGVGGSLPCRHMHHLQKGLFPEWVGGGAMKKCTYVRIILSHHCTYLINTIEICLLYIITPKFQNPKFYKYFTPLRLKKAKNKTLLYIAIRFLMECGSMSGENQ